MEVPPEPVHTAKEHLCSYAQIDIILAFFFNKEACGSTLAGQYSAVLNNSAILLGRLPNSLIGGRQIFFFLLAFFTPKTYTRGTVYFDYGTRNGFPELVPPKYH